MAKRSRDDVDEDSTKPSDTPGTSSDSETLSSRDVETKIMHLDPDVAGPQSTEVMHCSLPGHRPNLAFTSFADHDLHYSKHHLNRCISCLKNFPTSHLLSLHQVENHDPLTSILKDRGEKTFACFVEGCDKKCATPKKRKLHLIDKHMFPWNYEFGVVDQGIDRKTSMLRPERSTRRRSLTVEKKLQVKEKTSADADAAVMTSSDVKEERDIRDIVETTSSIVEPFTTRQIPGAKPTTATNSVDDMEIDDLSVSMSALRFVPPSVRFGRGKGRPGFSKS